MTNVLGSLRVVLVVLVLFGASLGSRAAEPPLRIVFPFPAGGAADSLARSLAERLQAALLRPVVVENRTGAAGRIGVQAVRDAGPGEAMLLFVPSGPMVLYPSLYAALPYDPVADFTPVARIATFDIALAVDAQSPLRTVRDLVAAARSAGDLPYGSPGMGTLAHLTVLAVAKETQASLRHVPYRGTPPALIDLAGGRIAFIGAATAEFVAQHRGGRVRVIATSGEARSPFLPEVPTLRESGVNFVAANWYALFAPARASAALVASVGQATVQAVSSADFDAKVRALGFVPAPGDAATLARAHREELALWGPFVRAAGVKAED